MEALTETPGRPADQERRRPLMGISLFFITGVFFGLQHSPEWGPVSGFAALALLIPLCFPKRTWSQGVLCVGLCLLGMLYGMLAHVDIAPNYMGHQITAPRCHISLEGWVDDDPVYTAMTGGGGTGRCELPIRLRGIQQGTQWHTAEGTVRVYVRDVSTGVFEYGERWMMEGLMIRSSRAGAPDRFSFYAETNQIRKITGRPPWSIPALCFTARRACAEILSRGIGEQSTAALLVNALLLGYRSDLSDELRNMFATTGTLHVFAISGLHVCIMAVMLNGLLIIFGISRERWFYLLLPALILYTLGTGGRASAVRACIMALIFWGAPVLGRRPDSLSGLALAALVILAADASQLVDPGFVLSFIVVAGLVLIYPLFSRRWHDWIQPDPWMLQPESRMRQLVRRGIRNLGDLFCVSAAAWLVSAPVTVYYFNLISPISLPGNMVVVPGTTLVMFTGCLSLVFGAVFPPLAELCNYANQWFIDLLLWFVQRMQETPGGHWFVQSPPPWTVMGWYAGLAILFFGTPRLRRILALVAALSLSGYLWFWVHDDSMTVDMMDAGQGNAALVNLPGETHDLLVDTGAGKNAWFLIRHLRRCGVDRLRVLVLTYPGEDVLAGAEQVLKTIPVRELWCVNPASFSETLRLKPDAVRYEALISLAREKGTVIRHPVSGDHGFARGAEWDVFWPETNGPYTAAQDASLVFRVARDGAGVLFMNGARQHVERTMARGENAPSAPVLAVGAHGAAGTCSSSFLSRVDPEWALLSVGPYNVFGDPHHETLGRLQQRGVRLWRTDLQGGVRVRWTDAPSGHYAVEALEGD